ncbi:MAG: choice-of-anchor D domain-containing protein [Ignavibacteriota bacterium]
MKRILIYCIMLFTLSLCGGSAMAQSCEKNMLITPNANSYAVLPSPKGISLPGAFTIEFWSLSSSFVPFSGLIEQKGSGNPGPVSITYTSGNSIAVTLRLNNGATTLITPTITNIQNWQHFAVSFTPNDSIRFFLGSTLIASQKTTGASLLASTDSIFISHSAETGATFTGTIDELRFWNTAHTSAQISAVLNTALSGSEAGLVGYYSFDDDPATGKIHDFTGRKSEGILVSAAALTTSTSPIQGTTSGYMLASKEQRIIFPDLICNTVVDTIVHIYNRGNEIVDIDPAGFQNGIVFISSTSVFKLPADSTKIVDVRIQANPKTPGIYRDTLVISTNTICGGVLRIPVELRFRKVAIAFPDSIFSLKFGSRDLLPCDLPDTGQTSMKNIGTDTATVTSINFTIPSGIVLVTPKVPFKLAPGISKIVRFVVLPGPAGPINTTLIAQTAECSSTASMHFVGSRIVPKFSIPDHVTFTDIHLPQPGFFIETTIYLKNTGTSILSMKPALTLLGGIGFKLITPQSGLAVVRPDSTLAIKIRYTSTDCGLFQTALHFQDQDNCRIDTLIPISINVLGPDVSADAASFFLGASCGAHDTTITLVNRSGRTVVVGTPRFTPDSILKLLVGSFPKTLLAGDSITLKIRFSPSQPGSYTADARFPLSPCGDALLHFSGILGVGRITLSDSSLDFGNGCDLLTATKKILVTNQAGKLITVTSAITSGSQDFTIIAPPVPFTIANNGSKELTIAFKPKQLPISDQAIIELTDSGCFVTRFPLYGVREIPNPSWSPTIGAEFGTVCPGQIATARVNLQNPGFGNDTILSFRVFRDTSIFHASHLPGDVIIHGTGKEFTITFAPKDTGDFLDYLQIVLEPCGDTTRIPLHGVGGPAPSLTVLDSLLDFKTIRVGSHDSLCIILQNQSCIPLTLAVDSIHGGLPPFAISSGSRGRLPDSISSSSPLTLCFVFSPAASGSFERQDTIVIGGLRKVITLHGEAGTSDLSYDKRTIDFGDVVKDSTKKIVLQIINSGSFPASLKTILEPDPDFSHVVDAQTIGATSSDTIIFNPKKLGSQSSFIVYGWEDHLDTITLLGRGTQPGLSFNSSLLDFQKVRLAHDSTIAISVTNTLTSQILIDSISIGGKFSASPRTPQIIAPGSSLSYSITYSPNIEATDLATLLLNTNDADSAILPLKGRGVEAHLSVDSTIINFGDVGLSLTGFHPLRITNKGGYPLRITSLRKKTPEFDTSTNGVFLIAPNSFADYIISFTPRRAINYSDSLEITADAPESRAGVALGGRGVFTPLGIPEVIYSIPDNQARVGDIVDIPISLAGKDLALFDIDSFHVDISYDPSVVYFLDTIDTRSTLAAGFKMKFERLAHDSTIRISGEGNEIVASPGRFFILKAMALLGEHDSTIIRVTSSNPVNTADLLSSGGSFIVTDCEQYRGGIIFKGNYSVSNINPNPVSSQANIDYEIGLPGRVHLDLYDQLGRHIRTIVDDDKLRGKHSATFKADDIPSGEYVYVFRSLEYESRGTMIISK